MLSPFFTECNKKERKIPPNTSTIAEKLLVCNEKCLCEKEICMLYKFKQ